MSKFVITQDIQEKQPLIFQDVEVEVEHLKTGDYSVKGYQPKFTVEHKTIKDLIGTCGYKNRERFKRELARMRATFDFYAIAISGHAKDMLPECNKIYQMQLRQNIKRIEEGKKPLRIMLPQVRWTSVIGSLKAFRADYNCHFYFLGTRVLTAEWILEQAKYFIRHQPKGSKTNNEE